MSETYFVPYNLPNVCCRCLGQAEALYDKVDFVDFNKTFSVKVPICYDCRKLANRSVILAWASVLAVVVVSIGLIRLLNFILPSGWSFGIAIGFLLIVGGTVYHLIEKKGKLADYTDNELRFVNPEYQRLFEELNHRS